LKKYSKKEILGVYVCSSLIALIGPIGFFFYFSGSINSLDEGA